MPVGKKTFKAQPKSRLSSQEDTSAQNADGTVGVFALDFPQLCAEERLPPVWLKDLGVCDLGEEEGTIDGSRFTLLLEYESDDQSPLRTIHIRGWLVTAGLVSVLSRALVGLHLYTLNLWNTGLDEVTLPLIVQLVQNSTIRKLLLDANGLIPVLPISDLLKSKSTLEHLSLKCCKLSDKQVSYFAPSLSANKSLLGLDLSCNHIANEGATALARGLRLNRTLLSLGLANNEIGDVGASSLAEVISRFALDHDEVVLWRKLSTSHRLESGTSTLDIDRSTREASPRRSPSVVSIDKSVKGGGGGGGGKEKIAAKGKKADPKKEDKGKKDDKTKKDTKKAKGKDSKAGRKVPGEAQLPDSPRPEASEALNPLIDPQGPVEKERDKVYLPGSTSLVFLTLAYNRVGEKGVRTLLEAVKLQKKRYSHLGPGLLRLTIHHNPVSPKYSELKELNALMEKADPLQRPNSTSPGTEPGQEEPCVV